MTGGEKRDRELLRRVLRLAEKGRATTWPNPRVGCVVVSPTGEVVGEGFHRRAGEPHAEVLALAQAGSKARGGTLYVNLEPCAHYGRTPPCVEAIVKSGVQRVVASLSDPDPRVAGQGFARLRQAGLEVQVGIEAEAAAALNLPFLWPRVRGLPTVTLKWASTLDGALATARGESQWITGPAARRAALALREEHGAVLVGVETVLADNPRLTRRLGWGVGSFVRILLDRQLRTPRTARLFGEPGPVWIYTEVREAPCGYPEAAQVIRLPLVTPEAVLEDLPGRGICSVLVEGGGKILGAFLRSRSFERVEVFLAPKLLGGEGVLRPFRGESPERLAEAVGLERLEMRRRGEDLQISGYRAGCLQDLCSRLAG
jgi:diaminohydroxyphosphoribosylaminopyrimidine deaminase/5-amino-6-(5-phosphoribosylamino)uracil reductase